MTRGPAAAPPPRTATAAHRHTILGRMGSTGSGTSGPGGNRGAGDGDGGQASSRPTGKCPVVPAPVKGARKRASLRDGASATLDSHGSFQEPGAYRGRKPATRHAAGVEGTPARAPAAIHTPVTRRPSPQVTAMKGQENCHEPYTGKWPRER
jgi:hypothetical protein